MFVTRKDAVGTAVTALILLAYVANRQDAWYLGSNRWAAATMLAVGLVGCPLAARIGREELSSAPVVVLSALGALALALGIVALASGAQWALLALVVVVLILWAGTTLRHAVTPVHPLPSH